MNTCRILNRLEEAEMAEPDIHLRSDYRQAFICVSLASRGEPQPFVAASYRIFGKHPDKVWPHIVATRKAKLGREFANWYDSAGNLRPDLPKKTSAPVTPHPDEQVPARLAAVLMFPKREVRNEDVEQTGSVRRQKENKGICTRCRLRRDPRSINLCGSCLRRQRIKMRARRLLTQGNKKRIKIFFEYERTDDMGYVTARQGFEGAKSSDDEALRQLADGLVQLSRAIEADFNKLESKIEDVERKVR